MLSVSASIREIAWWRLVVLADCSRKVGSSRLGAGSAMLGEQLGAEENPTMEWNRVGLIFEDNKNRILSTNCHLDVAFNVTSN